ncbi:MAG: hypothetical protein EBX47_11620 [Synechococcaceae bacterium WB8_1B_057]|nr:hypothetical protein [Synechococcaceae bacterium WB8_1B_057]
MNVIFITSSIYTNKSIFTPVQRISKTVNTFKSIKKKLPNSYLIFIESSTSDLNPHWKDFIKMYVDDYVELFDYKELVKYQEIAKDLKHEFVKPTLNTVFGKTRNLSESFAMIKGLEYFTNKKTLKNITRCYKISARYVVSEFFNPAFHSNNKFTFVKAKKSYLPTEICQVPYYYNTKFFSWNPKETEYLTNIYKKVLNTLILTYMNKKYADIDHLFWEHIGPEKIYHVNFIGIKGYKGTIGHFSHE